MVANVTDTLITTYTTHTPTPLRSLVLIVAKVNKILTCIGSIFFGR